MRVWVLRIQGGDPFVLSPRGNPTIEHDGGMTLAHLLCGEEELAIVKAAVIDIGCQIEVSSPEETPAMTAERHAILGRDVDVPCTVCGRPVEPGRRPPAYATPICYACLPPPKPLPI